MAMPAGALDVTSDTTHPLSIDLESWNRYDADLGTNPLPVYMYVCSRVPLVPGDLQDSGTDSAARLRLGFASIGVAEEPAELRVKIFRDVNGSDQTFLGGRTFEANDADCWLTCYRTDEWIGSRGGSNTPHGPIEMQANHANLTATQENFEWTGIWAHWKNDEYSPVACDRVEWKIGTKDTDQTVEPDNFASAYNMMSGFALGLNTYTLMNCGGFGCGVFAVPMFGYPEPES